MADEPRQLIRAGSRVPVGTGGREVDGEQSTYKQFTVSDIPLFLFEELSHHFGIGEENEWKNPENDNWRKNRDLDPTHPHIGFNARISCGRIERMFSFGLWDKDVLEYNRRHGDHTYPLLNISAGVQSAGVWAYGQGNLMAESGSVRFQMGDFHLQSSYLRFIALITFRASQMATNPNCVPGERYWQADRNPGGDYTRSSF